jgi:hypothetical protein
MEIRPMALLLLALSLGCAIEQHSVGPGLGGEGPGPGIGDAGADAGDLVDAATEEPDCTPGTEKTACSGTSCHPVSLVCTSMELASRGICETCFADSNCAEPNHRCVKMNHAGEPYPDETMGFCLQLTTEEGTDCVQPFIVTLDDREGMSGDQRQSYCSIQEQLATCDAVRAFHNAEACPSGRDDECPAGGLCRGIVTQGNRTEYLCTYACVDVPECSSQWINVDCAGYCGGSPP